MLARAVGVHIVVLFELFQSWNVQFYSCIDAGNLLDGDPESVVIPLIFRSRGGGHYQAAAFASDGFPYLAATINHHQIATIEDNIDLN